MWGGRGKRGRGGKGARGRGRQAPELSGILSIPTYTLATYTGGGQAGNWSVADWSSNWIQLEQESSHHHTREGQQLGKPDA